MIKVSVGIPESFKVGWYRHKITGSSKFPIKKAAACGLIGAKKGRNFQVNLFIWVILHILVPHTELSFRKLIPPSTLTA